MGRFGFPVRRHGMIDRRRDVDLSALPPDMAEIVRAFAAALRQAREEETEKLLLTLYELELLRDGVAELLAELRVGAALRPEG